MATHRTVDPIGYRDAWGFSGRGRTKVVHTYIGRRKQSVETHLEVDGPPRFETTLDPGEPRG